MNRRICMRRSRMGRGRPYCGKRCCWQTTMRITWGSWCCCGGCWGHGNSGKDFGRTNEGNPQRLKPGARASTYGTPEAVPSRCQERTLCGKMAELLPEGLQPDLSTRLMSEQKLRPRIGTACRQPIRVWEEYRNLIRMGDVLLCQEGKGAPSRGENASGRSGS